MLLVAGCDDDNDATGAPLATTMPTAPAVSTILTATTPAGNEGMAFAARDAGFGLAIPAAWVGHYTVEEVSGPAAASRRLYARFFVDFRFAPPPGSAVSSASILAVVVYAKADWDTLSRQPGPPLGLVVGEANNLVYIAQRPQSNPYDPASADGMLFDRMHRALDLRSTFALR